MIPVGQAVLDVIESGEEEDIVAIPSSAFDTDCLMNHTELQQTDRCKFV